MYRGIRCRFCGEVLPNHSSECKTRLPINEPKGIIMTDKLYTREDMKAAYDEGVQAGLADYRNDVDWMEFPDFMFKNYPEDATGIYIVSWRLSGNVRVFIQEIPANDLFDAAQKAVVLMKEKGMDPMQLEVNKKEL